MVTHSPYEITFVHVDKTFNLDVGTQDLLKINIIVIIKIYNDV